MPYRALTLKLSKTKKAKNSWGAILLVSYTFVVFIVSVPQLSYWWDEWTVLESITNRRFSGLFINHMGHFFPLGRAVFALQVSVFGSHYIVLVVMNLLLALCISYMSTRLLHRVGVIRGSRLSFLVLPLYVMSEGVQYDVQWGFQASWFMSVLFGIFVALELLKDDASRTKSIFLFLAAWMSLSSNLLLVSLMICCFVLCASNLPRINRFIRVGVLVFSAVFLTYIGTLMARHNPPSDPLALGVEVSPTLIFAHFFDICLIAIVMATSWLTAPIAIAISFGNIKFETYALLLNDNQALCFTFFTAISALLLYLQLINRKRNTLSMGLFLLLSLFSSCFVIAAGRYGNFNSFFHPRYAPILGLMSIFFWLATIFEGRLTDQRLVRFLSNFLAVLFVAASVVLVVRFPATIKASSFVGRIESTPQWLDYFSKCLTTGEMPFSPSIQPAMSGERICNIASQLEIVP